ncbi:MAG: HDOD domain-containing protein [Mariprofundaceae bacterium]|nr:HDOD domain-containing protein [Mariprofundaceae bacterium]
MQCPSCGTWYADTQAFCLSCGDILARGDSPAKIGHYRLIRPIGQGGMGMVFHAFDEELQRDVALKVLHQHLIEDPKQLERFRREARTHGQLNHDNIIKLLDSHDHKNTIALIMELIEGCTLKEFTKYRGALETGEIITLSRGILSGLQTAHQQHVTHRDLKLSNVLLEDSGGIKLMDFGLAKTRQCEDEITSSGIAVGSYYYMAPEQIVGNVIDARTDLYAFGVMLYRMATGTLPFTSSSGGEFEIMEKQVRHQPTPPENINPDVSDKLSGIIMNLLEKDPENRPADCETVLEMINRLGDPAPLSLKTAKDLSQVSSFSELHEQLQKEPAQAGGDTGKSDSAPHEEAMPETLLWVFHAAPEAPEIPPLDLRSPPPISAEVLKRLKSAIDAVPPLPERWHRIQAILNAPDASPSDLAMEVDQDSVLAAHVLKVCNSAAYAPPGSKPVTSVALALTRLGMDTAHDLILQAVVPDFDNKEEPDIEVRRIWFHSQAISLIARALAGYSHVLEARAASLFGMFHDIGRLVILHIEDEKKLDRLREAIASGTPPLKAEWDVLGYTHIDAGMMLGLHWRLPRSVHRFIYYHHHPEWHEPDTWPSDMQAVTMLIQISHLLLEAMCEEDEHPGIWSSGKRSHIPETESFLHKPLQLPLTNAGLYSQLSRDIAHLKLNFSDIFPVEKQARSR